MSQPEQDWERQRAFLAVLRTGSLSGAARTLRLAQPTIRRRIQDLEDQLGTPLFTRSPGGLDPTRIALALRDQAEAMADAAAAFARTASALPGTVAGTVRITASEVIAIEVLPPILADLRARNPDLVVELSPSNRTEDMLRRAADIAVRMVRPAQDALVARRIGAVRLGLHARRDLLAETGPPRTIEEASRIGMIGVESDSPVLRALQASGVPLRNEDCVFRSDSDLAHLAAIRAGIGIGLCQIAVAARDPALVRVLPDIAYDLETWLVMHEDLRSAPAVRATFDHLFAALSEYVRSSPPLLTSAADGA